LWGEPSRVTTVEGRNAFTNPHHNGQISGGASSASAEKMLKQLQEAAAGGEQEKAREALGRILQLPTLDSEILLRAGISLAQEEFYGDAAQAFARCVHDRPRAFACSYNLALADFALGRFSESLQVVEAAPASSPAEVLARRYLRGKILAVLGRSTEAERDLAAAFAGAPREENYALDLGLFNLRRRAYPEAVDVFERSVEFNPASPYLRLGLALAQYLAGHAAQSVKTCQSLLAQHPDFSAARLLMTFALVLDGQFAEAERISAAGLREPNPNPYLFYLHASALLKLQSKEYGLILQEISAAAHQIPACTLCYLAASKVHQAQDDYQAALGDLETAVRIDPDFPEAWYRLANVYEHEGRSLDATRARTRFQMLKAGKSDRENEMMRNVFLQTLGGSGPPHSQGTE
jgi:tetratricopeptide (TPR) repeat protein